MIFFVIWLKYSNYIYPTSNNFVMLKTGTSTPFQQKVSQDKSTSSHTYCYTHRVRMHPSESYVYTLVGKVLILWTRVLNVDHLRWERGASLDVRRRFTSLFVKLVRAAGRGWAPVQLFDCSLQENCNLWVVAAARKHGSGCSKLAVIYCFGTRGRTVWFGGSCNQLICRLWLVVRVFSFKYWL